MESTPTSDLLRGGEGSDELPPLAPCGLQGAEEKRPPAWRYHFKNLSERLHAPVSAFVVDLFRVFAGLLVVVYFVRLFLEFGDYTSESGFLDHSLHRHLFWFIELTLFYPGSPDFYKLALLGLGMMGAVMLTVGFKPKLGAVIAWIVAVSVHRWNFAVINVDDSTITLLLWWMLFLPIGHCLTYRTVISSRTAQAKTTSEVPGLLGWRGEVNARVDGFFVRLFFINLFVYYLTAGLTKLWSPLWREGLALFVILQLPLARTSGWWELSDLPMLWMGNHFTLIFEPLFPFLLLLPKGHPVKYFLGLGQIALHLAIPLSIGVPYANFALILVLILEFHGELDDFFRRKAGCGPTVRQLPWRAPRGTKSLAVTYLLVLTLAMSKGVPGIGATYEPAMATLYWAGVAQEYHLFDWIDRYNWWVRHQITVAPDGKESFQAEPAELFPPTVRGFIVQSYLLPMRWMRVPRPLTGEMRNSILQRTAERFVRNHREELGESGTVEITTDVARVTRDNLDVGTTWPVTLMRFQYDANGVTHFSRPVMPQLQGAEP